MNSTASYLKYILELKKEKNPKFSLRSFALKTGVSPSTLSKVLTGQKHLTLYDAHRLTQALKMERPEAEAFLNLTFSEAKGEANPNRPHETSQVYLENIDTIKNLQESTQVDKVFIYQRSNSYIQRQLVILKESETQKRSPHFYDVYVNLQREVAGPGYFIAQESGLYKNITATPASIFTENVRFQRDDYKVEFDAEGFPTINGIILLFDRNPNKYFEVDMKYSKSSCLVIGEEIDLSLKTSQPSKQIFHRIASDGKISS